jgi:hypothetical protein
MSDNIIPIPTTARLNIKIKKPEKLKYINIDYEEYGTVKAKKTVVGVVKYE